MKNLKRNFLLLATFSLAFSSYGSELDELNGKWFYSADFLQWESAYELTVNGNTVHFQAYGMDENGEYQYKEPSYWNTFSCEVENFKIGWEVTCWPSGAVDNPHTVSFHRYTSGEIFLNIKWGNYDSGYNWFQ